MLGPTVSALLMNCRHLGPLADAIVFVGAMSSAHEAHAEGTKAFRSGHYARARERLEVAQRLFAEVLGEEAPETLEALSDYGAACAALGERDAARAAHETVLDARRRRLGAQHPSVGTSLHNLGMVLKAQGDLAAAEACHLEGVRIWQEALGEAHPVLGKAFGALGTIARARGDAVAALVYARRSLLIRQKSLPEADPHLAVAYDDLAQALVLAGDEAAARAWFEAAVAVAPGLAMARHHLAACLARLGEGAAARVQRELALKQQSVFVQKAVRTERRRVLIPSVSDDGNVPLEHLLPERDFTRIWWFPGDGRAAKLPAFDVVFNGIGDPDMAGDAGTALAGFLRECGVRVFNPPDRIARTRRDFWPETLAGIEGIVMPPVCRAERGAFTGPVHVEAPFLLRPIGSHGGVGLRRVDSWDALDVSALSGAVAWYFSAFVESRKADGFYRKYRMAFVDRRPFAYHLAISPDWLVHYFSADMQAHDWKLAEEAAFLADPRAVLGALAYDAIAAVGVRLDLDFCGIDFTVLPDGRALVFEANATMLIHPESQGGKLAFKNPYVQQIIAAVSDMMLKT